MWFVHELRRKNRWGCIHSAEWYMCCKVKGQDLLRAWIRKKSVNEVERLPVSCITLITLWWICSKSVELRWNHICQSFLPCLILGQHEPWEIFCIKSGRNKWSNSHLLLVLQNFRVGAGCCGRSCVLIFTCWLTWWARVVGGSQRCHLLPSLLF